MSRETWLTRRCSEPPPGWAVGRFGRVCSRRLQPTGRFRRRSLSLVVMRLQEGGAYSSAADRETRARTG